MAPWQFPLIEDKTLDLFCNINSFQEMIDEHVENYFALADRKCAGLFFITDLWRHESGGRDRDGTSEISGEKGLEIAFEKTNSCFSMCV